MIPKRESKRSQFCNLSKRGLGECDVQSDGKTMQLVISLLKTLMPSIADNYQQTSALGSLMRAQQALRSLKTLPKVIETTEQLMVSYLAFFHASADRF